MMLQPAPSRTQIFRRMFEKDKSYESKFYHFNQPFCMSKLVSLGRIESTQYDSNRFRMLGEAVGPVLISLDDSDTTYSFNIYLSGYRLYSRFSETQTYIEWSFDSYEAAEEEYKKIME